MSSDDLLNQIKAAELTLEAANARLKSDSVRTPRTEMAELRDAVSLAAMRLVRLQGRWEREVGLKKLQTADH